MPRAPQRRASLEEEPGKAGAHHGPSNRREKQMEKITFTMTDPDPKKHSVKFAVSTIENVGEGQGCVPEDIAKTMRHAQFYIPRPFAENAQELKVTIEVVR
jgi:hypothetical protein